MSRTITYIGKSEYCYANSLAMLLAAIDDSQPPATIEVCAGIGLGAFTPPESDCLFFSPLAMAPDAGLEQAARVLGFELKFQSCGSNAAAALDSLKLLLPAGPVMVGPVDIGCLSDRRQPNGGDHFAVVYDYNDGRFELHDPAGYPNLQLPSEVLGQAWQADQIDYKKAAFQCWYQPRRITQPSPLRVADETWLFFRDIYQRSRQLGQKQGRLTGPAAIRQTADALSHDQLSPDGLGFLTKFQLPLAARRAGDYADLFRLRRPQFAQLKLDLARSFGAAYSKLVEADQKAAAQELERIADLETQVEELFQVTGGQALKLQTD